MAAILQYKVAVEPHKPCPLSMQLQFGEWTTTTTATTATRTAATTGGGPWHLSERPWLLHAAFGFHLHYFLYFFYNIFLWVFVTYVAPVAAQLQLLHLSNRQLKLSDPRVLVWEWQIGNMLQHMNCSCYFMNENWPHVTTISCL